MSLTAEQIKFLVERGFTAQDIADYAALPGLGTPGALRTRAYRQRRSITDKEWAALTREVIERDGWVCSYCDCDTSNPTNGYAIDHVFPLSRGGGNELENLTMSCRSCNSSKGDKILDDEWSPPNDAFAIWSQKGGLN